MKKISKVALLATLVSAYETSASSLGDNVYQREKVAELDQRSPADAIETRLSHAKQDPRNALERRPSFSALSRMLNGNYHSPDGMGVKKAGDASVVLSKMFDDAIADMKKLDQLMELHKVKYLLADPETRLLKKLADEFGLRFSTPGDFNELIRHMRDYYGKDDPFQLSKTIKILVKFNADVSLALAEMGIDPR